jgi:carboxyl-terminal processing protease
VNVAALRARALALLAGLALGACGGGDSDGPAPITGDCGIPQQNQAVYDTLQQYYLWYEALPELDPRGFDSPEALLDALVLKPLDRFSYITTQAAEDALFGASQFVGLGFRSAIRNDELRVADVFEAGPADGAGLVRGSTLLAVDGVPVAELLATPGGFTAALGPAEVGYEVTLQFRNPDGQEFTVAVAKDVVTIPPVSAVRIFVVNGRPTAYLLFRNFVEPSIPALDSAFAELRAAGVTQLIVDLRYNGGGLVSVLEHFANLLGSRIAPGAVFAAYEHNDKNSERDRQFLFASEPPEAALQLERLVLITTPATASASEMLVNGMPPYVTTATVGQETFGKPVGQFGFRFCEKVLRPVSFRTVNGLGQGDYFDGIPADCPAGDTLDVAFGQPGEASFDTAVSWLEQGFCPQPVETLAPLRMLTDAPAPERPRWQPNDAH